MLFRSLLLVTLACLISNNEASDILKGLPQAQVILQKFLDIVEANQLNVSIVTSRAQLWSNGQQQNLRDNALLMPPNNVQLTESQLSKQVGQQWLSDLQALTSQGKGIATYRAISVQNGKVGEEVVESSDINQVPMSSSWLEIISPEEVGENGLVPEMEDYEIMYNYLIPGANGQNQTVNVFAAKLNITIIDNSEHMPLTQITQIKQFLPKMILMFNDDDLRAEYLGTILNAQIPLSNSTWQVLIGPENFYIPSGNWVKLSIGNVNVIVFALAP